MCGVQTGEGRFEDTNGDPNLHARLLKDKIKETNMASDFLSNMAKLYGLSTEDLEKVTDQLPFLITPFLRKRVEEADYSIEAFRQFMPDIQELLAVSGYVSDPNDEASKRVRPWMIRSYKDRALLMLTMRCLVICRFCFRRDEIAQGKPIPRPQLIGALAYIKNEEIEDVVISGGDPLAAPRELFMLAIVGLCALPRVRKVRIDTRAVNTFPQAFDRDLLRFLGLYSPRVDIYAHMNHPDDVNHPDVLACIQHIRETGVSLYNQRVILAGCNDDPVVQVQLSKMLYHNGVFDYAVYLPDPQSGTAHFNVPDSKIMAISEALATISGPAIPQLVYVGDDDHKHRYTPGSPGIELFLDERRKARERMAAAKNQLPS
jgi:KamA family protein